MSEDETLTEETDVEYDVKVRALATHLDVDPSTITECSYGENLYECDEAPGEYLVVTDDEADEAWDSYMDNYIEECVLDQMPKNLRNYFDSAAFKRDAAIDGRGHSLASYDGNENEEKIGDEWIYIYRVS